MSIASTVSVCVVLERGLKFNGMLSIFIMRGVLVGSRFQELNTDATVKKNKKILSLRKQVTMETSEPTQVANRIGGQYSNIGPITGANQAPISHWQYRTDLFANTLPIPSRYVNMLYWWSNGTQYRSNIVCL